MSANYALIMAGGAGTRLWPISRQKTPKQFQSFLGDETLLQHMYKIAALGVTSSQILVMATPEFKEIVFQQLPDLPKKNFLYEPARRDNGPAITLAMQQILQRDAKAVVAVLWSDHYIQKPDSLSQALEAAFQTARQFPDSMVTIGSKPDSADTSLGYIQISEVVSQVNGQWVFKVNQFIEKPELKEAQEYVKQWQYFWNVGYKIMFASFYLDQLQQIRPELKPILKELEKDPDLAYPKLPVTSVEYLFTQKLKNMLVIPADLGWSDIGSWNTLHDVLKKPNETMVSQGKVHTIDTDNCLIIAEKSSIATVGVKNLVIVENQGAFLVMDKHYCQDIKKLTELLKQNAPELL